MELMCWIVFVAAALKLTKCLCFLLSYVLPGGRQAFDFWFRRRAPHELADRRRRRWRLITSPWRGLIAIWKYLFEKVK